MKYKKHTIERTRKMITTKRLVFGVLRATVVFLHKVTCPDGDHFFATSAAEAKRKINERIAEDYNTHALSLLCLCMIFFTTACLNPHRDRCIKDATSTHQHVIANLVRVKAPAGAYNNVTVDFVNEINACR